MHYDESYMNKKKTKIEKMVENSPFSLYSYRLFFIPVFLFVYLFLITFLYIYFLSHNFQFLIPMTATILFVFIVLKNVYSYMLTKKLPLILDYKQVIYTWDESNIVRNIFPPPCLIHLNKHDCLWIYLDLFIYYFSIFIIFLCYDLIFKMLWWNM